jgi:hypothetical protein
MEERNFIIVWNTLVGNLGEAAGHRQQHCKVPYTTKYTYIEVRVQQTMSGCKVC